MKKLMFFLVGILMASFAIAQEKDFETIRASIETFRAKTISKSLNESEVMRYNDSLRASVKAYLKLENSFDHPLDSLAYLGDLYSPDKAFRIVTWNIGKKDLTNVYFAFIQKRNKVNGDVSVELIDQSEKQFRTIDYKSFNYKNWFGALYYEIVPFKHKGKPHYILLGWDGNDQMSNKKIIEVLHFDNKDMPRFGANVFKSEQRSKKRIVMEYSKDVTMSLRYHPDKKIIVFDHLAPMKPELEGLYSSYAPDLSYDGYKLKSGEWLLKEAIDVFGKKNDIYNDPRTIKPPLEAEE